MACRNSGWGGEADGGWQAATSRQHEDEARKQTGIQPGAGGDAGGKDKANHGAFPGWRSDPAARSGDAPRCDARQGKARQWQGEARALAGQGRHAPQPLGLGQGRRLKSPQYRLQPSNHWRQQVLETCHRVSCSTARTEHGVHRGGTGTYPCRRGRPDPASIAALGSLLCQITLL